MIWSKGNFLYATSMVPVLIVQMPLKQPFCFYQPCSRSLECLYLAVCRMLTYCASIMPEINPIFRHSALLPKEMLYISVTLVSSETLELIIDGAKSDGRHVEFN